MRKSAAVVQVGVIAAGLFDTFTTVQAQGRVPEPPPLTWREITPTLDPPGTNVMMDDKTIKYSLFIPKGWTPGPDGDIAIVVHFHGASWFTVQEHVARGAQAPLVNCDLGIGSDVYKQAFEDRQRFGKTLKSIEKELTKRTGKDVRIKAIEASSFSAGYAAIRELLAVPEYFEMIQRVVLADSLYGRYKTGVRGRVVREPASEHLEPWVPLARAAMRGEKTFLITYSEVPTPTYASSEDMAMALLSTLGVPTQPVARGSTVAASDPDYPLQRRSDLGRFHVWGYAGKDQKAHLTHGRHLADFWRALDGAR
jgi:hypothetical protein